jgi:hypothetical protein
MPGLAESGGDKNDEEANDQKTLMRYPLPPRTWPGFAFGWLVVRSHKGVPFAYVKFSPIYSRELFGVNKEYHHLKEENKSNLYLKVLKSNV